MDVVDINNWNRSPPNKHRKTIDQINISNYRNTNITLNTKRQRPTSQSIQIPCESEQRENTKENQKNESERIVTGQGIASLQYCMARLADLAKGYGSISLDIPTTEEMMDNGKSYTLYVIKIMDPDLHQWEKKYRYRELLALHKHVMKNYPTTVDKPFPEKAIFKGSSEVIDWRKFLLQKYLRQVINHQILSNDPKVREYLFES